MLLRSSVTRLFGNALGKRRFRRHSGLESPISRAAWLGRTSLSGEPLETRNLLAPIVDFSNGGCDPACANLQAGVHLTPNPIVLGDANGDGQFDQQDIVAVLQTGKYRTGQPATFAQGDWNADGVFNQFDIVAALRTDRYVADAYAASSHGLRLTAVAGDGEGIVNVSPQRNEPGFSVEIQVAVWKTSPNTTFNVKRAFDSTPDGVCSSGEFIQFPLPNLGPPVQLTTSEGGAGATHIKFDRPLIADGTQFEVRFEVSTEDASIVLRTGCFTVSA